MIQEIIETYIFCSSSTDKQVTRNKSGSHRPFGREILFQNFLESKGQK